jgi:hypothetical protein
MARPLLPPWFNHPNNIRWSTQAMKFIIIKFSPWSVFLLFKGKSKVLPMIFFNWVTGGEWWASRRGRFTLRERATGTHRIGEWVGPRAGLDAVVRKNFLAPTWTRTPDRPTHGLALYHWAISAHSSSILGPNILLNTVFLKTLGLCWLSVLLLLNFNVRRISHVLTTKQSLRIRMTLR